MFCVYILFSQSLNRYYVGQSEDIARRKFWHDSDTFSKSFTKRSDDWITFLVVECTSRKQAVNIETHIKRMKSKNYLQNLQRYPEMLAKLKARFGS
jgi:putative endonuclease